MSYRFISYAARSVRSWSSHTWFSRTECKTSAGFCIGNGVLYILVYHCISLWIAMAFWFQDQNALFVGGSMARFQECFSLLRCLAGIDVIHSTWAPPWKATSRVCFFGYKVRSIGKQMVGWKLRDWRLWWLRGWFLPRTMASLQQMIRVILSAMMARREMCLSLGSVKSWVWKA